MTFDGTAALDASELRSRYLQATPWPHLVIDDAVAPQLAARVARDVAERMSSTLVRRRSRRECKLSLRSPRELDGTTRELLEILNGPAVKALAETVTGIGGLETDPRLARAGVFVFPPGGWQRVHQDFPVHPSSGLWNRVIALLFCSEWQPEWGGALELWPPDMSAVGKRIEPAPGRLVIFEPTSAHPHGVERVADASRPRVALACRFYAHEPPAAPPSRPLWRWSRRPSERCRDVWPTAGEIAQELRSRTRSLLARDNRPRH